MAEVKERNFSREDAYQLANRMVDKEFANYLIRETLMGKGFGVDEANEIIGQIRHLRAKMRHLQLKDSLDPQGFFEDRLLLILLLLALLVIIFYGLVNKSV